MKNIILNTDSYKSSHYLQYPPKSEFVSSYIEARGGDYDKTLFFGLQTFIKEYLLTSFSQNDIDEAKAIITAHGLPFNEKDWQYILDEYNGFLPIEISAVKEGMLVPLKCPLVQVVNTNPKLPWLTSYMETALLRAVWFPTTVATLSYSIKEIIKSYLDETSDNAEAQLPFKLHDFGARGTSSTESAMLGGMAHLVNFQGTDTMSGIIGARRYYGADMAGFSIPASEHSTMTSWQREGEADAYANMVKQFGGVGKIFAVVSDSYDIYNAVSNIWGKELKEQVKASGATLVIRPDSGEPTEIVLEVMKRVYEAFGGYTNSKGYIVLDDSVRIIQGDGVDKEAIRDILEILKNEGFSADNIAFGMGGGLLQAVGRDDFRFAMKASAIRVDGEWRDVYKDPVTDSGKRSKRGRLALTESFETVRVEELEDRGNLLVPVFRDGVLLREFGFDEVRENTFLEEEELYLCSLCEVGYTDDLICNECKNKKPKETIASLEQNLYSLYTEEDFIESVAMGFDYDNREQSIKGEMKEINSEELLTDGIDFFIMKHKKEMEKEFYDRLSISIKSEEKIKELYELIQCWYSPKSATNEVKNKLKGLHYQIKLYVDMISNREVNIIKKRKFKEKYKSNILLTIEDISKILTINKNLFDLYLQKWISEYHPKKNIISTSDIYFRRGLIVDNLEELYLENDYINSYTISRTVSEQFATMSSENNKIINGEYGLFDDRILFFSPFIKGIGAKQLEIGIIPHTDDLRIEEQGVFGNIEEYILREKNRS